MKKSEQYHVCQVLVANALAMDIEDRLEILSTLMNDEDLARFSEEREAQKHEKE